MAQPSPALPPAGAAHPASGSVSWRRLPIGAELPPLGGGVHFRLWAPRHAAVRVVLEGGAPGVAPADFELTAEPDGYFSAAIAPAGVGTRYRFALGDDETLCPDPASRFQPDGPHGPSVVVDPTAFPWTDAGWQGLVPQGQVFYELHVGTFTPAGTWAAAAGELSALADLGITAIEVMPVADFTGRFGWGYDGVNLFAPTRLYGAPDDFRAFVDRAHALRLGVILDVVYNHLGPDGNYLRRFADSYFTERYRTDWGDPFNFDGPGCGPVRELIVANAGYWIDEFHLDGLRLDATQNIYDLSGEHILAAAVRRAHHAAGERGILVVVENEPQHPCLARPAALGGFGCDMAWNDDFHHAATVAVTGCREGYYSDYRGTPQELVSAAKRGYLYQGQWYGWQRQDRGLPAFDVPPWAFVAFLQNHDQIANSAAGLRLHRLVHPGAWRAITTLLLLGPGTPLLFQGQEYAATQPFLYFADLPGELASAVRRGRADFLAQFRNLADPAVKADLSDPGDPATFARCRLDPAERRRHGSAYALHRDLLALRRGEAAFAAPRAGGVDGAVLGPAALVLRFFAEGDAAGDRLLLVNLGPDLALTPAPEPLLAPPAGCRWAPLWSSEDPRYGGSGTLPFGDTGGWLLTAYAARVLTTVPGAPNRPAKPEYGAEP